MSNFWKAKKILITGGVGFIGSFVVEELIKRGALITVPIRSEKKIRNIEHLSDKINLIKGDLLNSNFADSATKNQDIVFHLASFKKNIEFHKKYPADILRINILLTINVLEATRKNNTERLLMVSSGIISDDGFQNPDSPHFGYGWSKKISEILSKTYNSQYGMKIAIARPYNTFGPRDNFDKESAQVVPAFIRRALEKENPFLMWGDGSQKKSFLYVEDLARGLIDLLEKYSECDPIDFCSDEIVTIKNLVEMIMDIEDIDSEIEFDLSKPKGAEFKNCDSNKCFKKLKFKPKTSLREGLIRTIKWYKNNTSSNK